MIAETQLSVTKSCTAIGVSTQAVYAWKKKEPPPDEDRGMVVQIEAIALEFPKYGYRRITKQLQRQGFLANHKRVRRIMKEKNLLVRRRKYKPVTTYSGHGT